ncbi:SURP and G-patch domain-containing protein 1 isoform X2 [Tetranychus urticae]|nr:SURP and G-patch domain-containing protein 1 isoform X2 [Tetranychus urticae]XP_015791776.1 SURP and G-patch domain-containing protein 1 isoform X2 [Tetranychus urticae]
MSNRNRSSRSNRWEEITHQEQLILAKKREIEERLKSSGDVSMKNEQNILKNDSTSPSFLLTQTTSPDKFSSPTISSISTSISKTSTSSPNTASETTNSDSQENQFVNRFQNDGSFLEMFKKLQQQKSESSFSESSTEKTEETNSDIQPKLEDIDERVKFPKQDCDLLLDQQTKVSPSGDDEIRMAIEKSAIYVAMNGSDAEAKLKNDCINDSDYRWLYQEDNVNHQYYKRRVEELKEAKTRAADFESSTPPASSSSWSTVPEHFPALQDHDDRNPLDGKGKKKKESRWSEPSSSTPVSNQTDEYEEESESSSSVPLPQDPELVKYAIQVYGRCDLTSDQWKQLEDQRKMKVLVQMIQKKRRKRERLERSGKNVYEYDSDEEVDGGTWEHRKRMKEMEKTAEWAAKLTEMNKGKHHLGDFLPPDQLERFMKKWDAIKDGSTSLLFDEDYRDFKLQSENQGYKMLAKLGWSEGQGLGVDNQGTTKPVDVDPNIGERAGLGQERPDELKPQDDEYEAYRKRMMLAYRFRPNPLNNPRRPYY